MTVFLDCALHAAKSAREVILNHYRNRLQVEIKADRTPVTIADREAETVITDCLLQQFPDHGVHGEEHGRRNADADYLWLVDPIDGTKSFVQGYGFFSTQIALMHRGRLILGVSCAPAMNELAWAEAGHGAWLNGDPLSISEIAEIDRAAISTGNIQSLASDRRWQLLGSILGRADRTRGYGDFYHYHRLAAGQLDAVIESDLNILDIAALTVIVTEAGGRVTDLEGRDIGLSSTSVLAANSALHRRLLAALNG